MELFGWQGDQLPVITDADLMLRDRAELMTDDALESAFSRLDGAQSAALIAGTEAIHAALQ